MKMPSQWGGGDQNQDTLGKRDRPKNARRLSKTQTQWGVDQKKGIYGQAGNTQIGELRSKQRKKKGSWGKIAKLGCSKMGGTERGLLARETPRIMPKRQILERGSKGTKSRAVWGEGGI